MRVTLVDGTVIDADNEHFAEGAEGRLYFSRDKKYVVKEYNYPTQDRLNTLIACIGPYNIYQQNPDYWSPRLGWPMAIIQDPFFGMVMPRVPGETRTLAWFLGGRSRLMLAKSKPHLLGNWLNRLNMATELARIVSHLHLRGLCHADFSYNNFLANEAEGRIALIDCDGLVIPDHLPPAVLGTPGYMAPEIYMGKARPTINTDKHAMAVLLFQLLLFRHPLQGRKIHSSDPQEDDRLMYGERALYTEHPTDPSNRPPSQHYISADVLGGFSKLFLNAFVDNLFNPGGRPVASTWAAALERLQDRVIPCKNSQCPGKFFPLLDAGTPVCPWCGTTQDTYQELPVLQFYRSGSHGHFSPIPDHKLAVWKGRTLHIWHVNRNKKPGPELQPGEENPVADFHFHQGQWRFINQAIPQMYVVDPEAFRPLPPQNSVVLKDNMQFMFGDPTQGLAVKVMIRRI